MQYKSFKEQLERLSYDDPFFEKLYQHHAKLTIQYRLLDIHCPIHLFKAAKTKTRVKDNASNYWEMYVQSSLKVYETPGDHDSMLAEPHVVTLASQMEKSLIELNHLDSSANKQDPNKYQADSKELFD